MAASRVLEERFSKAAVAQPELLARHCHGHRPRAECEASGAPADTSLTRSWAEQDRRAEAHDLLAPVYGWFTEGFETRDLNEARRCSISRRSQGSDRRTLIVRIPMRVQHRGDAAGGRSSWRRRTDRGWAPAKIDNAADQGARAGAQVAPAAGRGPLRLGGGSGPTPERMNRSCYSRILRRTLLGPGHHRTDPRRPAAVRLAAAAQGFSLE
jgi:hypothetical protein